MKRISSIFLGIVIISVLVYFLEPLISARFSGFSDDIKDVISDNKEIFTPGPLKSLEDSPQAFLTRQGVISEMNRHRQINGLPPLVENSALNNSAYVKVADMFARQYFEHVSPTGISVSDLVEQTGYDFLSTGENLALGNFKNDKDLVQAWMDSPGHRANILNTKFRDIGVSVVQGKFDGRTVWLAVQHFGLSIDVCPEVNETLRTNIESRDSQLNILKAQLDELREKLDRTPKNHPDYSRSAEEYNALVSQYNDLLEEHKSWIAEYNIQVRTFNSCLQLYQ